MVKRLLKRSFIAVVLVALFACAALCVVMLSRPVTADEITGKASEPTAVYVLGASGVTDTENGYDYDEATKTYTYTDHASGWSAAIVASQQNGLVKVSLASDWTATLNAEQTSTSFGEGTGFDSGVIWVPNGADVILDLNGCTIDRGLSEFENPIANGTVLFVNGNTTVTDGSASGNGKITGGNTTGAGGGISSGGNLTIEGGAITGNLACGWGGGIYQDGAPFVMTGGEISHNTVIDPSNQGCQGGGAFFFACNAVISGGKVSDNEARGARQVLGGGICFSGDNNSIKLTVTGDAVIENNKVVGLEGISAMGGGILSFYGQLELSGDAAVKNNTALIGVYTTNVNARAYAGGIYIYSGVVATISDNAEVSGNQCLNTAQDGSTFMKKDNSAAGGIMVAMSTSQLHITGGRIVNNAAYMDGGIFIGGKCYISGGEISGNYGAISGGLHAIATSSGGVISVSGDAKIYGNYSTSEADAHGAAYQVGDETRYVTNIFLNKSDNYKVTIGELKEGANIGITTQDTTPRSLTIGYAENNSVSGKYADGTAYSYAVDAAKYLKSDKNMSFAVNSDGEVVELEHKPQFSAAYAEDPTAADISDYGAVFDYERGSKLADMLTYNGAAQSLTVKNGGETVTGDVTDAGIYTLEATVGGASMKYTVVINPKTVTSENLTYSVTGTYTYDGNAKEPSFTLSDGSYTLTENDYEYELANNTNAGDKAQITVTYKGNYTGTVVYYFTIVAASGEYTVHWEYKASESADWVGFGNNDTLFTYNAVNYNMFVRARLTASGGVEDIVYAESDDDINTTNMYLTYSGDFDGEVTDLVNATDYTVTIAGSGNYVLNAADKTVTIRIAPRTLDISASDFVDYNGSGAENRLWVLQLGADSSATAALRDLATYYDPNAEFDSAYGANVTQGTLYNSYVRYTGSAQTVLLNNDYCLGNTTLAAYMTSFGSIEYNNSNTAVGEENKVNKITTTVRLNLNGNWETAVGGNNYIEITKEWYIVTINNALRTFDGATPTGINGWTYGDNLTTPLFRPEHGDSAVYTIGKEDGTAIARFAVKFSGTGLLSTVEYYDVKQSGNAYIIDETKPASPDVYLKALDALNAGGYTLNISTQKYVATADHVHWWGDDEEEELADIVYYPISRTFRFAVERFNIVATGGALQSVIEVTLADDRVAYTGNSDNLPEIAVTFRGKELKYDVDYSLTSSQVNVGKASFKLIGKGNFEGDFEFENAYDIVKADNSWIGVPSIMRWSYNGFVKEINLLSAMPRLLDDPSSLWFAIARDSDGEEPISGLEHITLDGDGLVSADVERALKDLPAAVYYLFAHVDETSNYYGLEPNSIPFRVFAATNSWEITPTVTAWTEGKYDKSQKYISAASVFGTAHVVVKGADGKVYYDSDKKIDRLADAEAGRYTLTAYVDADDNYSGLEVYTVAFQVFEKAGLPWWVTLVVVLGVILVLALVIFILWKKGVFRILTDKLLLAIRTKATVDATIAAVRANKVAEQSKLTVAKAKAAEQAEARKEAAMAERAKPATEKAAALEEKAKVAADRAEKLRARSEAMIARAERLRVQATENEAQIDKKVEELNAENAASGAQAAATDAPADNNVTTPTEE